MASPLNERVLFDDNNQFLSPDPPPSWSPDFSSLEDENDFQKETPKIYNFNTLSPPVRSKRGAHLKLPPAEQSQSIFRERSSNKSSNGPSDALRKTPGEEPSMNFHFQCQTMSTLDDLWRVKSLLAKFPDVSQQKDDLGSTPLHRLASNQTLPEALFASKTTSNNFLKLQSQSTFESLMDPAICNLQLQLIQFVKKDLLSAFPQAMILKDEDGCIPFEACLMDWVHSSSSSHSSHNNARDKDLLSSTASQFMGQVYEKSSRQFKSMLVKKRTPSKTPINDVERGFYEPSSWKAILDETDTKFKAHSNSKGQQGATKLSSNARFALVLLSAIIDQLDHFTSTKHTTEQHLELAKLKLRQFRQVNGNVDLTATVVQATASIPGLMQSILLLENEEDREFVLSTSAIQRVMACKQSIGVWLTQLLQDPNASTRAVEYLERISSNKEKNCVDPLIHEMCQLQDFVPALLSLGDRGMEEASTTLVVKGVLDRMISKPFAVTVVFCDVLFLTILMVGFRLAVTTLLSGAATSLDVVLQWIYVANIGIFYFLMREIGKLFSVLQMRRYVWSFWNVMDFLATLLSLASTVSMRYHFAYLHATLALPIDSALRILLAITTGFLWLRVLSLLKAINMQLATFVLAILQITKDIVWFCVILLTLVVSFSQMFFTLLAPPSCSSSNESNNNQCQQSDYLLGVYTILLGDFGQFPLERFTSGFSIGLLVLYSFLITVVLLNVLIAIASDSYEKCLLRSQQLFGRARIMLVAELVSFQNLLKTRIERDDDEEVLLSTTTTTAQKQRVYNTWWVHKTLHHWSRGSVIFLGVSLSVIVIWTLAELFGWRATGERHGNLLLSLASVFVNVILFVVIMLFLAKGAESTSIIKEEKEDESTMNEKEDVDSTPGFVQRAMLQLLGTSKSGPSISSRFYKGKSDIVMNEWSGRVNYLRQEMSRHAKNQQALSMEQFKAMEDLITLSESRLRTEVQELHEFYQQKLQMPFTTNNKQVKSTKKDVRDKKSQYSC